MYTYFRRSLLALALVISVGADLQAQSDVVITEIMYNLPGPDTLEFIELYNNGNATAFMGGWLFQSGIAYVFPTTFSLPAGEYTILCRDSAAFFSVFGIQAIQWDSTLVGEPSTLSNGGETIRLANNFFQVVDEVTYDDDQPIWPSRPDGNGSSLVLCDPSSDNDDPFNWDRATISTGITLEGEILRCHPMATCATIDSILPEALRARATGASLIDVWYDETMGATALNPSSYGFPIGISAANDITSGRLIQLTTTTPMEIGKHYDLIVPVTITDPSGNPLQKADTFTVSYNPTIGNLVITEIMYDNPGEDTCEFIELYNAGSTTVVYGGYRFNKGVNLLWPEGSVEPGEYVVFSKHPEFINNYFSINSLDWGGESLGNKGEKLSIKNTLGDVIDTVRFDNKLPWDTLAAGYGYSLVLCNPALDNSNPINWSRAKPGDYAGVIGVDPMGRDSIYATPGKDGCLLTSNTNIDSEILFQLYPNPASSEVVLTMPLNGYRYQIELMDLMGQILHHSEAVHGSYRIDVKNLVKGIYLVRVIDSETNQASSQKFIRQ